MPDPNNIVSLSHTHCQCCCFSTICIHTWYIAEGRNSFSSFSILSVVKFYGALWCICKVVCSIVTILPHAHVGSLHLGRCPSVSSDFASTVVFFVFFHSFLLTLTFYLTADASPFFSPSSRNIPTPTTCSCEGRRSCLELRESTMLRCWLRGRRITRSVRKRSSLHYTVHVICLPLLAISVNYNSTMPLLIYFFLSPHADLEKIKSYIDSFRYGAPPHGGGGIGKYRQNCSVEVLNDNQQMWLLISNLSSRPGESVHVVPGPPQRAPDLHVPTWPQASDTLNPSAVPA